MTMRVANAMLNSACDAAVDLIDVGTGDNGTIEFYSGSPPGSLDGTPAGDLLAVVDFQDPAFGNAGAVTPGVASAVGTPLSTTGVDDGTIGFARVLDADDSVLLDDDDVGTSGNNILVNTTAVSIGVDFAVTAYDFSAVPQS